MYRELSGYLDFLESKKFEEAGDRLAALLEKSPSFGPARFHRSCQEKQGPPPLDASGRPFRRLEGK